MRSKFGFLIIALACVFAASVLAEGPPPWAYGFNTPPGAAAPAAAPRARTPAADPLPGVPGSDKEFVASTDRPINTEAQPIGSPDHGPMPDIVEHGRQEAMIAACSLCRYQNGRGRPGNARRFRSSPISYFIQTCTISGPASARADPRKASTNRMIAFAKKMTDNEVKAAAGYFEKLHPKWTRRG